MNSAKHKKNVIGAILLISLFQMGMVALAPIIAAVKQTFPNTSELAAQMATTFLNFTLVIVALFSGVISKRFGRRAMAVCGLMLFVVAGICGCFFTNGIAAVFVWSGILGVATGLFVPVASSMMVDCLEDSERSTIAGRQTACVNIGGVIFSLGAGFLAAGRWNTAYLIYVAALPVALFCLKAVPREAVGSSADAPGMSKVPREVWLATLQATIFAVMYFTFSTNVSLLLAERGFNSTTLSGAAAAVFMVGGAVLGLLFKPIFKLLGSKTSAGAFVLMALSYISIYLFDNVGALLAAAFFGGGSLSVIFPFFVVTIANKLDPKISVISTSLILSVGPNLGSFLSPMVITNLSELIFGSAVSPRFLLAGVLALLCGAVLAIIDGAKRRAAA